MKTVQKIEANIDNLHFGYWDAEAEEFIELKDTASDEQIKEMAEKLDCSPKLVEAIQSLTSAIVEYVGKDLKDIWQRID